LTKYVIRTDVNNQLLSYNKKTIVFDKKEECEWIISPTPIFNDEISKFDWIIEEFNETYDPLLHLAFEDWMGKEALKGNMIPDSIRRH